MKKQRDVLGQWVKDWRPRNGHDKGTEPGVTERDLKDFYHSPEWKELRRAALETLGRKCMRCGATEQPVVDHIKPVRSWWALRFNFNNLQILCRPCNHGKGTWVTMDFRPWDPDHSGPPPWE